MNGKKLVAMACASFWEPLLSHEFFDLIIYDCLDAIDVHAADGNYDELAHKHALLVNKANIVFATAAKLREDILWTSPEKPVVVVSNGVDGNFFAERCCKKIRFPVVSGKVVGYVGAVRDWIDIDLLAETARMMSHITFVIVGPIEIKCQDIIKSCPDNIVFVGEQPYDDVPAWIARFDVALIPFRNSAIAEATNPVKLYEYFQLGKPVVATPMRELSQYCDDGLLYFADNAKGFAEAITLALDSGVVESEHRKNIAGMNSWQSKARMMMEQIINLTADCRSTT
ncbi:glycosyltransferase [Geobacter sp. OR-1]|uniref:glycosyltransferase n=1 Tax=Geobacter sp. OR-1 TaxID=1266765 RepID=UPI0013648D71|nr:glycosyltransferase [Geobacter sp. OR-1]